MFAYFSIKMCMEHLYFSSKKSQSIRNGVFILMDAEHADYIRVQLQLFSSVFLSIVVEMSLYFSILTVGLISGRCL
jgi:hypothetical protein